MKILLVLLLLTGCQSNDRAARIQTGNFLDICAGETIRISQTDDGESRSLIITCKRETK